ncbi:hypothetical protein T492DRAFT_36246 [Pavlovales sp. CCMP2436]|nr:hypothetical protein T492DRAFT_36246 [Pavlovales sp. CCMP2436]
MATTTTVAGARPTMRRASSTRSATAMVTARSRETSPRATTRLRSACTRATAISRARAMVTGCGIETAVGIVGALQIRRYGREAVHRGAGGGGGARPASHGGAVHSLRVDRVHHDGPQHDGRQNHRDGVLRAQRRRRLAGQGDVQLQPGQHLYPL